MIGKVIVKWKINVLITIQKKSALTTLKRTSALKNNVENDIPANAGTSKEVFAEEVTHADTCMMKHEKLKPV